MSRIVLVGMALLLLGGAGLWVDRLLAPRPDRIADWFPVRVGCRWTYRDADVPDPVVFEVVRQTDLLDAPALVVARRRGTERLDFCVSVDEAGFWILGTSDEIFSPPFREFAFPLTVGARWEYVGHLDGRPVRVESRVVERTARTCRVVEFASHSGSTTFWLEKGKGVVRLQGKGQDPHGGGNRVFDWKLEKMESDVRTR